MFWNYVRLFSKFDKEVLPKISPVKDVAASAPVPWNLELGLVEADDLVRGCNHLLYVFISHHVLVPLRLEINEKLFEGNSHALSTGKWPASILSEH